MAQDSSDPSGGGDAPDPAARIRELEEANRRLQWRVEQLGLDAQWVRAGTDSIPIPIFVKDRQGRYVACNTAYETVTGLPREQMLGRTVRDIVDPESARRAEAHDRDLWADPRPLVREHRMVYIAHGARDVRVHLAPLRDEQGNVIGLVGALLDVTQRKRAQEALRQSEQKYRALVEGAGDAIASLDENGVFLFVNGVGARRLGRTPAEVIGKKMADFFPPEVAASQVENVRTAIRQRREVVADEKTFVLGQPRWYHTAIEPLESSAGRPATALVIARDMTQQKEAEEALRESEKRLQDILDNCWDVIFRVDLKGDYTYGNAAAERSSGWSLAELMRMNLFELLAPEYHDLMRDRMARRAAGEEPPQPFQFEIIHRDGHRVHVELFTSPLYEGGALVGIQGIARDISERTNAERELRSARARLEHLIAATPGTIYSCKPSGDFATTFISGRVVEQLGCTPQEFLEDPGVWARHVHPDDVERVVREVVSLHEEGRHACEYRFLHKDGTYRWMRDEMILIRDAEGRPVEAVGFWADITERKRAEEALREAHRELMRAREEERKRLAADLHDSVGQQLIALHLAMQDLAPDMEPRLNKVQAAELHRILQSCQGLIAEVRNVSHGLYPPLLESLGLVPALRDLAGKFPSLVPVQFDGPRSLEKTRFSPDVEIAVFRIAQEAVRNAVRHGQATRVKVALRYRDRQVVLSVRDDGVGFDVQSSESGMGLASMKERAGAVGGRLEVDSAPGSTRVELHVPADPRPKA